MVKKYKEIMLLVFYMVSHQSIMAQTDAYYVSHMKDVLSNSCVNKSPIGCIGTDSIFNYNITIPELSCAKLIFRSSNVTIEIPGTACYADMDMSGIILCLRKLPCCDGNIVSYLWCRISGQNNTTVDTICRMSHSTATILPLKTDYDSGGVVQYHTKNCVIRSSPFVDDDSVYYELRQKGNTVASLREGAEVYVLGSQGGSPSLWFFVAVKHNDYVSEAFAERDDKFVFGWLQETDLYYHKKDYTIIR